MLAWPNHVAVILQAGGDDSNAASGVRTGKAASSSASLSNGTASFVAIHFKKPRPKQTNVGRRREKESHIFT